LIDVKAVDETFRFQPEDEEFIYYACARDGWLYVNNPRDGSWLFVDSRRTQGLPEADPPTPYWLAGTFADNGEWTPRPSCGFGNGGDWNPSPPDNGVTENCGGGEPCPQPGPGRPDDEPPACTPTMQVCHSDSQCPAGQLCLPAGVNGRSCQCPRRPRADLVPEPAQATEAGGGISGEGLPGFFFCAPLASGSSVSERVIVRVRNAGAAAAGPSNLEVTFLGGASNDVAVGPLPPGAASVRSVRIPESCYGDDGGNCTYEIIVDADDEVLEQSNANNTRSSICLQPEG
jgi:hypothetical protein